MDAVPEVKLWFELETRCNLRCPFCFNHWKSGETAEPGRADHVALMSGLDRLLAATRCTQVALSGGEPLLHPDLPSWVRYFAQREIPSILTTNGVLLTEPRARALAGLGLGTVQIPLLAGDRQLHDRLSGRECWEDTIRSLVAARGAGLSVVIVFVATRVNVGELPQVCRVAQTLGIDTIIFNRFIESGAGKLNAHWLTVSDEAVGSALEDERLLGFSGRHKIIVGVPVKLDRGLPHVHVPARSGHVPQLTVDSAGNLKRCNQAHTTAVNILGPEVTTEAIRESLRIPLPPGECYCVDRLARQEVCDGVRAEESG